MFYTVQSISCYKYFQRFLNRQLFKFFSFLILFATKIRMVIQSFDHPFFENPIWGLQHCTRKIYVFSFFFFIQECIAISVLKGSYFSASHFSVIVSPWLFLSRVSGLGHRLFPDHHFCLCCVVLLFSGMIKPFQPKFASVCMITVNIHVSISC